ncbi:proteasome subunit alpha type-3-like [Phragmites australis]|uniref:proteasome subunit alpha type-3-like n=1 Tax=Phragmites australis TaxID=29695 RepID=UPI002D7682AC|nr:proteasome subunit alpha type-3-like [Phragmites australis]
MHLCRGCSGFFLGLYGIMFSTLLICRGGHAVMRCLIYLREEYLLFVSGVMELAPHVLKIIQKISFPGDRSNLIMSSIGTGYDLSVTTFSPDGRAFQVEYTGKAVDNGGTIVGIKCKDGIVLGVVKLVTSKMILEGSNRRIHSVHRNSGLVFAGLAADGRQIVSRAKSEEANYEKWELVYGQTMPVKELADRVASYVHPGTLYWWLRPFGCGVILGGYDRDGPQLYIIEPSGLSYKYFGVALGKGKQAAKTEIENLKLSELTCMEGIVEVAKIIYGIHDEVEDKAFELELSWVCNESNRQHQKVPADLLEQAKAEAQAALEEMDAD